MAKKHPAEIELARLRSLLQPPLVHFPAVDVKKLLAESTEKSKMGQPIARAWFLIDWPTPSVARLDFNPQRIIETNVKLKDAGPAYGDEITATIALRNKLAAKFADTLAALDEKIGSSFGLGEMLTSQHAMSAEPLKTERRIASVPELAAGYGASPTAAAKLAVTVTAETPTADGPAPLSDSGKATTKIAKRTPKQARIAAEKAETKKEKFVARGVKAPSKDVVKAKADKIEKLADKKKAKK